MSKLGVSVIWNWVLDARGDTSAAKPRLMDDNVWRVWKPRPFKANAQHSSSSEVRRRTNPSPGGCLLSLHRQKKRLLECFCDPAQEAGRVRSVDEAMVVGKRER